MEQYLKDEYDVYEDENWLKNENQIEDYFKDNGRDWLECGQGYYQDEADILCKIEDKFYKVHINAEVLSARQDRGEDLFWVESITSVKYKEVKKPNPKEKMDIKYELNLTKDQKEDLEKCMDKLKIKYEKFINNKKESSKDDCYTVSKLFKNGDRGLNGRIFKTKQKALKFAKVQECDEIAQGLYKEKYSDNYILIESM